MTDAPKTLDAAQDRIRDTAKWLTVSLALIGGVVLAGTQLSSIGKLMPGDERFTVAAAGGALALVGTAAILWSTVWVATTRAKNLTDLAEDNLLLANSTEHPNRPRVKELKDATLLQGFADVKTLAYEYTEALRKQRTEQATQADVDRVEDLDGIVRNVLKVAAYVRLSTRWRIAAAVIAVGGAVAAVGVVMFVWAANPPPEAAASVVTPGTLSSAEARSLELTAAGAAALKDDLGPSTCDTSQPIEVRLLGTTDVGPDVLVDEPGCTSVRFIVTDAWGHVKVG